MPLEQTIEWIWRANNAEQIPPNWSESAYRDAVLFSFLSSYIFFCSDSSLSEAATKKKLTKSPKLLFQRFKIIRHPQRRAKRKNLSRQKSCCEGDWNVNADDDRVFSTQQIGLSLSRKAFHVSQPLLPKTWVKVTPCQIQWAQFFIALY